MRQGQFYVRLPQSVFEKIKQICDEQERSYNYVVTRFIEQGVRRYTGAQSLMREKQDNE
tara:strand:+ start:213 stop:389 length:177 start_codon:yes stop_codon:yes gene_type:complete